MSQHDSVEIKPSLGKLGLTAAMLSWKVSSSPYGSKRPLVCLESTHLHSNDGQNLHGNAVEFVKTTPGAGLSQPLVDIAAGLGRKHQKGAQTPSADTEATAWGFVKKTPVLGAAPAFVVCAVPEGNAPQRYSPLGSPELLAGAVVGVSSAGRHQELLLDSCFSPGREEQLHGMSDGHCS